MYRNPGLICFSLIFALATATAHAADCRTSFDNRCFSAPTSATRAVDCQTSFDERCLDHHATDAEIEADALASQHRIEALLQEQYEAAAWWDAVEQQEAAWGMRTEPEEFLVDRDAAPPTLVFFRAPVYLAPIIGTATVDRHS